MYEFSYHRPHSLKEAVALFNSAEEPAYLSGGHTLVPTMKNRLAAPDVLIDLRAVPELHGITSDGAVLKIGAASTHFEVSHAESVCRDIPALARMAGSIGDVQVRNLGTLGGSIANNDPAADYPAAALALGATIVTNQREIAAEAFFTGLFSTDLEEGEIVTAVHFPVPEIAGYAKFRSQASHYAVAAVFVARTGDAVRVAVTGAGADGVFRWKEAEAALSVDFRAQAIKDIVPDESEIMSDMHADAHYRSHLVAAMAWRALDHLGDAYID